MFRHKNQLLSNQVANGQQVEVLAVATLYEQRRFSADRGADASAGLGVLYEKFERLKQLWKRGFSPPRANVRYRIPQTHRHHHIIAGRRVRDC